MRVRRLSLTAKLSLLFACSTLVVFSLVGAVVYYELSRQVNLQDDQDIVLAARHARRLGQELSSLQDMTQHIDRLTSVVFGNRSLSIEIRRLDGTLIAAYDGDEQAQSGQSAHVPEKIISGTDRIGTDAIYTWQAAPHTMIRSIAAQIPLRDGTVVTVLISRDMHDRWLLLDRYRDRLKTIGLFGILLSFVLGFVLVRASLSPLRDIAKSAEGVTVARLGNRIDVHGAPPELAAVVFSLNAMLNRLDTGFRRLSQFTTDLAHDMRTPLSNMRGATEVALSRDRTQDEYQLLLASNLEECDRLSRMIENVLFLGRAEHPQFVTRAKAFDVHAELSRIAAYFEGLVEDAGIVLSVSGDGTLYADVELFRRAVSNLIANAVRYTPSGKRIVLEARTSHDATTVVVSNEGTPLAPDQMERIFDRFYRGDPSRHNESGSTGAAGLGLAIVRSIMDLHHGRVYAQNDHGFTRFYLVFGSQSSAPPIQTPQTPS